MSSFSSPSPSSREHSSDSAGVILSQAGCVACDKGQMTGIELGLMETTEVEYIHLQHFLQAHIEAQAAPPESPDVTSHPAAGSTASSPLPTTQAIDLSTSTEEHCVAKPEESTPAPYGEVPDFVMARIRGENSLTESPENNGTSVQKRSRSAARVCLEKRFNSLSAVIPRQEDIPSAAVFSNFLMMLQRATEAHSTAINPQMQKWMKTEVTSPFLGSVYNPVTNMCGQVIGHIPHMVEPNHHQGLIIPKSLSLNFHPEEVVTKAHITSSSNATKIENDLAPPDASMKHGSVHNSQPVKTEVSPDGAEESGNSNRKTAASCLSRIQRKEKHNSRERERRKKIRLCCDELNTLVPFCDSDTDRVTTLQWTTDFLRYIHKTYGNTFKEEFQNAFTDKKNLFPSSGQDLFQWEKDESLNTPLAVEQ